MHLLQEELAQREKEFKASLQSKEKKWIVKKKKYHKDIECLITRMNKHEESREWGRVEEK